ncbi:MAG TPA: hypothetical protein VHT03_07890 [Rhizomicrobium sp.]|nr:hypothetical protein [Rhizomicrobium sp.]
MHQLLQSLVENCELSIHTGWLNARAKGPLALVALVVLVLILSAIAR